MAMRVIWTLALLLLLSAAALAADPQPPSAAADAAKRQAFLQARIKASKQRESPRRMGPLPAGRVPHFSAGAGTSASRAAASQPLGSWIVQLAMPSAAAALAPPSGDRAAVAAAAADPSTDARGRNITAARVHAEALDAHITAVAAAAGVDSKVSQRYTYALSGFALKNPTVAELQALRADPQVVSVTPSTLMHQQTYSSPWFLGLTSSLGESPNNAMHARQHPQGLWDEVSLAGDNTLVQAHESGGVLWVMPVVSDGSLQKTSAHNQHTIAHRACLQVLVIAVRHTYTPSRCRLLSGLATYQQCTALCALTCAADTC